MEIKCTKTGKYFYHSKRENMFSSVVSICVEMNGYIDKVRKKYGDDPITLPKERQEEFERNRQKVNKEIVAYAKLLIEIGEA